MAQTLSSLLLQAASDSPSRHAFLRIRSELDAPDLLTYGDLDQAARRVAAALRVHATPNTRVAIVSKDVVDHAIALFGCAYAGMIPVSGIPPFAPRSGGKEDRHARRADRLLAVMENSGATLLLTYAELAERLRPVIQGVSPNTRIIHFEDAMAHPEGISGLALDSQKTALIQYTSGSTGNPRGVALSPENIFSNIDAQRQIWSFTTEDVGVSWLPPHHDLGLIGTLLAPMHAGFPCVVMSPAYFTEDPMRWLRAISRYQATVSWAPNFAFRECARRAQDDDKASLDLSTLRFVLNGAEPISKKTIDTFSDTFSACGLKRDSVTPGYGLAEATLAVTSVRRPGPGPTALQIDTRALADGRIVEGQRPSETAEIISCGPPVPDLDLRIIDPATLELMPDNAVGEIWCRGLGVINSYYNEPNDPGDAFGALDCGRFLRTGDLGFTREGELYVCGRLKDILIVRGSKYYPQDIEYAVEQCPNIRIGGVAALSVDHDSGPQTTIIAEIARPSAVNLDAVISEINRAVFDELGLETHRITLIRVGGLLKTPSGKVQRKSNKDALRAGHLPVVRDWAAEDHGFAIHRRAAPIPGTLTDLRATLIDVCGATSSKQHLSDLGFNSMSIVELAGFLREWLDIHIKTARIFEIGTIEGVALEAWTALADPAAALRVAMPSVGPRSRDGLERLRQLRASQHLPT